MFASGRPQSIEGPFTGASAILGDAVRVDERLEPGESYTVADADPRAHPGRARVGAPLPRDRHAGGGDPPARDAVVRPGRRRAPVGKRRPPALGRRPRAVRARAGAGPVGRRRRRHAVRGGQPHRVVPAAELHLRRGPAVPHQPSLGHERGMAREPPAPGGLPPEQPPRLLPALRGRDDGDAALAGHPRRAWPSGTPAGATTRISRPTACSTATRTRGWRCGSRARAGLPVRPDARALGAEPGLGLVPRLRAEPRRRLGERSRRVGGGRGRGHGAVHAGAARAQAQARPGARAGRGGGRRRVRVAVGARGAWRRSCWSLRRPASPARLRRRLGGDERDRTRGRRRTTWRRRSATSAGRPTPRPPATSGPPGVRARTGVDPTALYRRPAARASTPSPLPAGIGRGGLGRGAPAAPGHLAGAPPGAGVCVAALGLAGPRRGTVRRWTRPPRPTRPSATASGS